MKSMIRCRTANEWFAYCIVCASLFVAFGSAFVICACDVYGWEQSASCVVPVNATVFTMKIHTISASRTWVFLNISFHMPEADFEQPKDFLHRWALTVELKESYNDVEERLRRLLQTKAPEDDESAYMTVYVNACLMRPKSQQLIAAYKYAPVQRLFIHPIDASYNWFWWTSYALLATSAAACLYCFVKYLFRLKKTE